MLNYLRWLAIWTNFVAKRYTAYLINGYQFHIMTQDVLGKTQNSGLTLSSTINSIASATDPNHVYGMIIYYGFIKDIITIDY